MNHFKTVAIQGNLPDFLVIGARKAGTTALWKALRQHPTIFMPDTKEPGFFAFGNDTPAFHCPGSKDDLAALVCDEEKYKTLFSLCPEGHKAGEASPVYLEDPRAPFNAARYVPRARLVVMLRQPVERAFSNWVYYRHKGIEEHDNFESALQQEPLRLEQGWRSGWGYMKGGFYGRYLDRWLEAYPRESLLVLFYDDWVSQPQSVLDAVCRHIGVTECDSLLVTKENQSLAPRSTLAQKMIMSDNPFRTFARRFLPVWMRDAIMWPMLKINLRPKPKLDPVIRRRLTERFEQDICRLEQITGRNLMAWRQ
jgi:hypothetical protein